MKRPSESASLNLFAKLSSVIHLSSKTIMIFSEIFLYELYIAHGMITLLNLMILKDCFLSFNFLSSRLKLSLFSSPNSKIYQEEVDTSSFGEKNHKIIQRFSESASLNLFAKLSSAIHISCIRQ